MCTARGVRNYITGYSTSWSVFPLWRQMERPTVPAPSFSISAVLFCHIHCSAGSCHNNNNEAEREIICWEPRGHAIATSASWDKEKEGYNPPAGAPLGLSLCLAWTLERGTRWSPWRLTVIHCSFPRVFANPSGFLVRLSSKAVFLFRV